MEICNYCEGSGKISEIPIDEMGNFKESKIRECAICNGKGQILFNRSMKFQCFQAKTIYKIQDRLERIL